MISRQTVYIGDFYETAKATRNNFGVTNLYSTGINIVDSYLGGGFGRVDAYEIVVLFGPTGVGKSTVSLNFVAETIKAGKKVGLLILEDDMADVSNRLWKVLGEEAYATMNENQNVLCIPKDAMENAWSLDDMIEYIESWYKQGVELILVDHLQFIYENAESIKGENEYIAQRVFMRKLNGLMKRVKKTIILVNHVNKQAGAKGMDKIVGSGAIAQAATKVIEISEGDLDDSVNINMLKSRFTKKPGFHYTLKMLDGQLKEAR